MAYNSSVTESTTTRPNLLALAHDARTDGRADEAVALLSVVSDPIRWQVLQLLFASDTCVCNLQEYFPVAANLLSYHLKVLRDAGLVTTARRGRWVDYSLADDAFDRLRAALPGLTT